MQTDQFTKRLKEELTGTLPGEEYQNRMASPNRFDNNVDDNNHLKGSVLLLVYPSENLTTIVFIRKPFTNGVHGGQISFPGGKIEDSDSSISHAALRETEEEIGVPSDEVTIQGSLSSLYVPASNFLVYPVVGYIDNKPDFHPNPHEVQQIIEVSLHKFVNPDTIGTKIFIKNDRPCKAPCYNVDNHQIWGATAMILSEFVEVVRRTAVYEY